MILVTGATGQLGAAVVRQLLARTDPARNSPGGDRSPSAVCQQLRGSPDDPLTHFVVRGRLSAVRLW